MKKQRSYFVLGKADVCRRVSLAFFAVGKGTKALLFEYVEEAVMNLHCRATAFFLQTHLCNVFFQETETCT